MTPDVSRPSHNETRGRRTRRFAGGVLAGTLFLNACSSLPWTGSRETSPASYVAQALDNPSSVADKTVLVGPITAGDITYTKVTCGVTKVENSQSSKKIYQLAQLSNAPGLFIFFPPSQMREIFKPLPDKSDIFLPKEINSHITLDTHATPDPTCPMQKAFLASIASASS